MKPNNHHRAIKQATTNKRTFKFKPGTAARSALLSCILKNVTSLSDDDRIGVYHWLGNIILSFDDAAARKLTSQLKLSMSEVSAHHLELAIALGISLPVATSVISDYSSMVDFLKACAAKEPVLARIKIYLGLADVCGDRDEERQLISAAESLRRQLLGQN